MSMFSSIQIDFLFVIVHDLDHCAVIKNSTKYSIFKKIACVEKNMRSLIVGKQHKQTVERLQDLRKQIFRLCNVEKTREKQNFNTWLDKNFLKMILEAKI